jgi:hypothetical protein
MSGFADVLHSLGVAVPTLTWTKRGVSNNSWAIVDHVLFRGPSVTAVAGATLTSGLWARFPAGLEREGDADRMCGSLLASGSDHMPIIATIAV